MLATLALVLMTAAAAGAEEGIETTYTLLVGHPESDSEPSGTVLIVPGPLMPSMKGPDELSAKLREAYRLKNVTIEGVYLERMETGRTLKMPSPAPEIDIRLTLTGSDDSVATYRVKMTDAGEVLVDTPVSVKRGGRAVVGSRNGEAAPYVFAWIGAAGADPDTGNDPGIVEPRVVARINPRYPEQARKNRIQGEVILKALVDKKGDCRVMEIVSSPDPLLSEAAREAVEQWKYEPGRSATGEIVEAEMAITVKFRLE